MEERDSGSSDELISLFLNAIPLIIREWVHEAGSFNLGLKTCTLYQASYHF